MRILIDIGHPAHVHLFKNFAHIMINKGHKVHFTTRDKEFEIALLQYEGFSFSNFGKHYKTKGGKIWGLLKFSWLMIQTSIKFRPDIYLSHGSIYATISSFLFRRPNIALEDTGNMEQVRLYRPFTKKILVPEIFNKDLGKKQIRYKAIHELFYLHPSYFIADDSVFSELGLSLTDEFIIIRLISWKASHDKRSINRSNYNSILRIVKKVLDIGIHVFISSETNLSPELEPFRIKIVPQRLHHVLAFAKLYIGEGGTTATEACILGTPSIIINEQAKHIGIHQQLQNKYKLQFYFDNINDAELKIFEILNNKNSKLIWSERRNIFLENNINPTNYLINFILHKKWQK